MTAAPTRDRVLLTELARLVLADPPVAAALHRAAALALAAATAVLAVAAIAVGVAL